MEATNGIRERMSANLKSLMKLAGMQTQKQLAAATGISQTQIGYILRSEKGASIDILDRLANGLGCDPWVLLSPNGHVEAFDNSDLQEMVQCYLRLSISDQDSLKSISKELFQSIYTERI